MAPSIFLSVNIVKPSLSQKCSKFEFETKFPVQLWAISWAMVLAPDLSPLYKMKGYGMEKMVWSLHVLMLQKVGEEQDLKHAYVCSLC